MKIHTEHNTQHGLTLVELLIAMVLGVFLIGGLLQLFVGSRQTYQMQEGLSRLQENGRFALDFITKDIRMAGFRGCSSNRINDLNFNSGLQPASPTNYLYAFTTTAPPTSAIVLQGFEATSATEWEPAINQHDMNDDDDMSTINKPTGGSDVFSIRRSDEHGFLVSANASGTADISLDAAAVSPNLAANPANFEAAGLLKDENNNCAVAVISNCTTADVFQISAINAVSLSHAAGGACTPGNASASLVGTYLIGDQVFPIHTTTYYVRKNTADEPALYRRVGSNKAEELVEGVEKMEILYGVDADAEGAAGYGIANYYVTANNVLNWGQVVSVYIRLLLATEDGLKGQAAGFNFNGLDISADRRIRRVFSATVAVRNRSL